MSLLVGFSVVMPCMTSGQIQESQRNRVEIQEGIAQKDLPGKEEKPRAEVTEEFEKIWKLVKDRFYTASLNGLDWKKVGEKYRAHLPEVKTEEEFQDLVNKMLAELHASHTEFFTKDEIEYSMLPSVLIGDLQAHQVEHIGVMGRQVGKEYLVASVMEGGPAEQAGIQSGDRLLSVEGKPFSSAGAFRGKEGRSVRVELRREGEANSRMVTVVPEKQNILRAFLTATEKSARVLNVGGKKIAYLHLWTMSNEAFKAALEQLVMTKLHSTDGMILDLRDGYGGNPFGYGDVFFRPDVALEQQSQEQPAYTRHTGYNRPMVVLINHGTRSAKEFFSYQFKVSRRAKLVGTRTAGAFLGASAMEIGKDGLLELAVMGLKVDGKLLEEVGVAPDITVQPQFSYTERDSQLLAAEQILLEAIKNGSSSNTLAP
jgi:carboxyl-terminal processing protease